MINNKLLESFTKDAAFYNEKIVELKRVLKLNEDVLSERVKDSINILDGIIAKEDIIVLDKDKLYKIFEIGHTFYSEGKLGVSIRVRLPNAGNWTTENYTKTIYFEDFKNRVKRLKDFWVDNKEND